MTEYFEKLVSYSDFFEEWQKEKYISKANEPKVRAIWDAYKVIEPNAKEPFGCPGCVVDMLRYANIQRVSYIQRTVTQPEFKEVKTEPVKMTFPKQKKKKK